MVMIIFLCMDGGLVWTPSQHRMEESVGRSVRPLLHARLNPQCMAVAHTHTHTHTAMYTTRLVLTTILLLVVLLLQTKGLTGMAVPKMAVYIQDG